MNVDNFSGPLVLNTIYWLVNVSLSLKNKTTCVVEKGCHETGGWMQ